MAGSKERERRRARDRFEQQRAARLERQRRNRKRAGIGARRALRARPRRGRDDRARERRRDADGGEEAGREGLRDRVTATASATASASPAAVTEPAHALQLLVGVGRHGGEVEPAHRVAGLQGRVHGVDQHQPRPDQDRPGELEGDVHRQLVRPPGVGQFLEQHPVPPAVDHRRPLHAAVRRPDRQGVADSCPARRPRLAPAAPGTNSRARTCRRLARPAASRIRPERSRWPTAAAATNGSQFFLVFKNTTLGPDYTPFGTITSGLDILQNVAKAGTSCTFAAGGGVPKDKVIIDSVSIKKT